MSIDIKQFIRTFYEESFEGLDTMESNLLNLDVEHADAETINSIFRAAHSIKGGSGTFGFPQVSAFTHLVETLLDELRSHKRPLSKSIVTLLLESIDCLRNLLSATRDNHEVDSDRIAEVEQALEQELGKTLNPPAPQSDGEAVAGDDAQWRIRFKPHRHMLLRGNDVVLMCRELATLGDLQVCVHTEDLPDWQAFDPEQCYLSWDMTLTTGAAKQQLLDIFEWVEDECDLIIESDNQNQVPPSNSTLVSPPAGNTSPAGAHPSTTHTSTSSIRVDIDKVDDVINLVGELVITQSMLGQVGGELSHSETEQSALLEKLRDGLTQLERNTRQLQESVMRIRMVPISYVFSRFPRLVRDLSHQLDKEIHLSMSGEQTELDKTVMEKIGDPLVHLVRNAIDHGLEAPEKRTAAGKPAKGTVHMTAYHKGGNIVIEIEDDGAGIQKDKILAKAVEKGIWSGPMDIGDEQVFELLFEPGLSTAEKVSDVSGRGVGMDVVKKNIKALGGNIEVQSKEGQGTKFIIRLPLTLSILDGQLVRVGTEVYVIPLTAIVESLQIKPELINSIAATMEVYQLRNEYIPILRLANFFNCGDQNNDEALMVLVEAEGKRLGLIVNELMGQQQVVVKSLESNYKRVAGLSAATILGDGTVALILDIADLTLLSAQTRQHKVA